VLNTVVKQRLVGAMVLIALGVIFLPSLFSRESDGRVEVNTQSLIPPQPDVRTVVITSPQIIAQIPAPSPNDAFQPSVDALDIVDTDKDVLSSVANPASGDDAPISISKDRASTTVLTLNQKGLPTSWVVQVASFQSQLHANALNKKLRNKDYKSYVRPVNTAKGDFFRVLVGPYIDNSRAIVVQKEIDKAYRVKSRILRFSNK
jgi:DedD protein